jgi:hypothetical protein
LSGLSTIQFRLSFKAHKSLEYCCLEIQTFKLHDLGIYFRCWVHKAQQRSGPESPRLIIIFPQKRKFRVVRASATSTNCTGLRTPHSVLRTLYSDSALRLFHHATLVYYQGLNIVLSSTRFRHYKSKI